MKMTMKYLSMASLFIAGAMMFSCSNENDIPDTPLKPDTPSDNVVTLSTTISFDGEGTTRALTEGGVKTFAADEQIAVVYQKNDDSFAKAVATLTASDISNSGKSATITVSLTNPKTDGTVKYIYPAAMAKDNGEENFDALNSEQDGTFAKLASTFDYAKFEGTFDGTELPVGDLTNQLALCKFTIKDGDGTDITSQLTKLTIKNGSDVYHVNTSSLSNIWVALKPITSGKIDIYAAKNTYLYRKTVSDKELNRNTLTPIKVTAPLVPGALSGLFSVNDNHDLVYFSQGNLQARWHNSTWANWYFAAYQHDFIKNYQGNVSVGNPQDGDVIDLFGWSTNYGPNYYGINASTEQYYGNDDKYNENYVYQGKFYDWGDASIQNGGASGCLWRTPSKDDFNYILNQRSASTISGKSNARFIMVHFPADIYGKIYNAGIVLFPDNFVLPTLEHTTIPYSAVNMQNTYNLSDIVELNWDDWGKMEAAGAVYLPAAGDRIGTTVRLEDENYPIGGYWTSTTSSTSGFLNTCAVTLLLERYYEKYQTIFNDPTGRHCGQSVRLVGPGAYNQ